MELKQQTIKTVQTALEILVAANRQNGSDRHLPNIIGLCDSLRTCRAKPITDYTMEHLTHARMILIAARKITRTY